MQELEKLKTRINLKAKTVIALLIILGSNVDIMATALTGGPHFDILKTHIDRSYDVTDHLSVDVHHDGSLHLVLTDYQFYINSKDKLPTVQHIEDYPDLSSNRWTKEWKCSDLPIFCKAEHRIQQKSGIAFRFRLGSVDYVNALEGK